MGDLPGRCGGAQRRDPVGKARRSARKPRSRERRAFDRRRAGGCWFCPGAQCVGHGTGFPPDPLLCRDSIPFSVRLYLGCSALGTVLVTHANGKAEPCPLPGSSTNADPQIRLLREALLGLPNLEEAVSAWAPMDGAQHLLSSSRNFPEAARARLRAQRLGVSEGG